MDETLDLIHPDHDYSSAPSEGSSAASTFESRFMLVAWTSAIRCLNFAGIRGRRLGSIEPGHGYHSSGLRASAPTGLTATAASASQINLSWAASPTSGVNYNVYDGTGTSSPATLVASGIAGTSYQVNSLAAATTYSFVLKAVKSAVLSAASNQASATTQTAAGGACHIAYLDQNDWGSGFTGNLSITVGAAITSWTVTWTYSGNQALNQAWNSNYTQSGHTVTLTNASWNGSIAAGATLTGIGWNANYSGTNASPTAFYLNGVLCH